MVSNDNVMVEGMKILSSVDSHNHFQGKEIIQIADALMNILCIETYYYGTGVYKKNEVDEQREVLRAVIVKYNMSH